MESTALNINTPSIFKTDNVLKDDVTNIFQNLKIEFNELHEHSGPLTISKFHPKCIDIALKLIEEKKIEEAFKVFLFTSQLLNIDTLHPFCNLHEAIDIGKKTQLNPNFGAHFSGLGGSIVKGGHIRADIRNLRGINSYCLQLKLNDFARTDLKMVIECIEKNPDSFEKIFSQQFPLGISITFEPFKFYQKSNIDDTFDYAKGLKLECDEAVQIHFNGLGKINMGNNPKNLCLYNNIDIELDAHLIKEDVLFSLNSMLCSLGLGAVTTLHGKEEEERIKTAKIFRTYFPIEATQLEMTREYFFMKPSKIRPMLEKSTPEMTAIFKKYLDDRSRLLKKKSVYPGKEIWSIKDFHEQLRQNGAVGLQFAILGNPKESAGRIALMLKTGALSTQDRFQASIIKMGISSCSDLKTGGGESVFARLVSKNNITKLSTSTNYTMLFDLAILNRGGYAYKEDCYGNKNPRDLNYSNRQNLIEFTKCLTEKEIFNEVMIKNYIPPKFIKGILVLTEEFKDYLIPFLTNEGAIQNGCINKINCHDFIKVAKNFKPSMWD
ncbi:MAG: hypothetical protein H0U49_07915 [Parachlamydiaceae bacterium]|nr:hypothetical protein [Parachlamydiaceae bacterium]